MKIQTFRLKVICFFLSIVLIMACLPTSAIAMNMNSSNVSAGIDEHTIVDPIIIDPIIEDEIVESATLDQLKSRASDAKTISELKEMEVDVSSLPSFINSSHALQKGHVNRLKSSEKNLSTVVFQNKDGTETTYIFMQPVKYIDVNGNVKDKSAKIESVIDTIYSYGMLNNNTKIYFPKNSNLGTKIQYQNYVIQMLPVTTYSSSPTYIDDTTVAYSGVFGENTILTYKTKLNGVKEDIVLVKNIGQNEFNFTLTLSNLTPVLIDGVWYLQNSSENIVASLGKIIVNDSAGNSVEGTMSISPSNSRSMYSVKITVPIDFLNSNSTVYPVYVDPSTTIWEDGYYYDENGYAVYYDAIQDTGLYTTDEAVNSAIQNQTYHKLGSYSSATGKIIYKLYDFYGEYGQFTNLTPAQIGNAYLYINVESGTSTTVTAYPMTSTWDNLIYGENPLAINESILLNAYSITNSSSSSLGATAGEYAVNITDIVRGWTKYNNNESTEAYNDPNNGFMLNIELTASYRTILSTEALYSNSVYVVIDANTNGGSYYINNVVSGKFMKRFTDTKISASNYSISDNLIWELEYFGNDKFLIRSKIDYNYVLHGFDSKVTLGYLPTNLSDDYMWYLKISEIGGVIIENVGSGLVLKYNKDNDEDNNSKTDPLELVECITSSDEEYEWIVWGIVQEDRYINLDSFSVTIPAWIPKNSELNCQLSVTPSNATWKNKTNFYWKSSDPSVATVNTSGRVTAINDGYTNIVVTHKPTGVTYIVPIVVGQMVSNGTYQIKNVSCEKYIDIEGPSTAEGAYMQIWSFLTSNREKWLITYDDNGYYHIKSVYSNKYIGVSGASSTNGAPIIQTSSYSSDACKWKITITPSGNYKFTAKISESNSIVLSLPPSSPANGRNLVQMEYTDDTTYTDEWFLLYDAALLARIDQDGALRNCYITNSLNVLNGVSYFHTYLDVYSSEFMKSEMKSIMSTTKMFSIHTHGDVDLFVIGDQMHYYISDIMNTNLSNLRLAMFLTCLGGTGGYNENNVTNGTPSNLVEACIYSGATTAVAFEQTTSVSACNTWFSNLLELMSSQNLTLQQAINELDDPYITFGEDTPSQKYQMSEIAVVGGDESITLNEIFS